MKSSGQEQRALKVAVYGNVFMAALGLGFAWYTDSQAVLLDGVFSLMAFIISILTLYVSHLIVRPGNDEFPFGYAIFEPILNLGKGLIIGVVMLLALFNAVETILAGGSDIVVGGAVIYALLAAAGCTAIVIFMRRQARATESPIIEVEVKNWTIDAAISGVVALSFFVTMLLEGSSADPYLQYVDSALVVLMALFCMTIPYGIIRDNWSQIVGAAPPDDLTEPAHRAIDQVLKQHGLSDYRLRLGRFGRLAYVQLYVVFSPAEAAGIDSAEMDQFRARLYELLRQDYANLALDVVFTQDPVWAERAVNADA
jgi:cation diffusion facilitator family transporter